MKLRHSLSGDTYALQDDGTVLVTTEDEKSGIFRASGEWIKGEVRDADIHLLGFIAGPSVKSRHASQSTSDEPTKSGVSAPNLNTTRSKDSAGRKEMDLGLDGQKALVTAASRGIGLAIAQTLADQGCDIAICARGDAGLETARKDLEARGAKVFTKAFDMSDSEALEAFIGEAAEALDGLDVFVSNASAGGGPGAARVPLLV